jgi:UDP-N-acetylglucosamine enolpyruvyl transferase
MDQIIISGGRPLKGTVKVSGAKNAALPILASSLLGGECIVTNVPRVVDVATMCKLLSTMGAGVSVENSRVAIQAEHLVRPSALACAIREAAPDRFGRGAPSGSTSTIEENRAPDWAARRW